MNSPALTTFATALAIVGTCFAQQGRYRDPVFARVDVQNDIAYGSAVDPFTQQIETLRLDLYTPQGDVASSRPGVVVVHGGGFVSGDKGSAQFRRLGTDFAQRGYVAISINYRLAPPGSSITAQVITDAAHDMKAAVRWLRQQAAQLHLDVDRIGCIGSSAGAITCLEAAYVSGDGASGNPGFSAELHAVVDLWGFLRDTNTLDPGEAPVQIIHGTLDPVVAYTNATDLKQRADAVGVSAELWPIAGAGHAPFAQYFASYHEQVVGFFYEHMNLAQLAGFAVRPGYASPGTLTMDSFGLAGDSYALHAAAGSAAITVPGLGLFCLDPISTFAVTTGQLPNAPRLATDTWTIAIPAGVSGLTLHWQGVQVGPNGLRGLTNCVRTDL